MIPTQIVLLYSGGMDSTVLLYDIHKMGCRVHCVLFNYGQIHVKELEYARRHVKSLEVESTEIDLNRVKNIFLHCALTDGTTDNLVVPFRNGVMLSIACAVAASNGIEEVAYACNADDKTEFPDCRWAFIKAFNAALEASGTPVQVIAPYIGLNKKQIVARAKEIGAPYKDTWSCYNPFWKDNCPCGKCLACKKRKAAMR